MNKINETGAVNQSGLFAAWRAMIVRDLTLAMRRRASSKQTRLIHFTCLVDLIH